MSNNNKNSIRRLITQNPYIVTEAGKLYHTSTIKDTLKFLEDHADIIIPELKKVNLKDKDCVKHALIHTYDRLYQYIQFDDDNDPEYIIKKDKYNLYDKQTLVIILLAILCGLMFYLLIKY